jgi:hypothetical protein
MQSFQEESYFVMRKSSTGVQRRVWISPNNGDLYCGVCLRGRVRATLRSKCTSCGSEVAREFAVVSGGVQRPGSSAIRAERKKREQERSTAAARSGNLLIMKAS